MIIHVGEDRGETSVLRCTPKMASEGLGRLFQGEDVGRVGWFVLEDSDVAWVAGSSVLLVCCLGHHSCPILCIKLPAA